MLQYIFQWIGNGAAEALNYLLELFMSALSMDMNTYIRTFPFLSTGYYIFRGIGMGLTVVFAVISLLKFLTPAMFGAREPQDTVWGILLKTALAAMLVFAGNFLTVKLVEIAKIPYERFISADIGSGNTIDWSAMSLIKGNTALTAGAVVLESLLTVVIAWNVIKLMVEVAERYMIVGIMVYTAPPFFATAASQDTMDVFKKWLKMFVSSLALMSVSVFFLKVMLSGFKSIDGDASPADIFVKLLLILAVSKIAQHADEYLNQLGLNAAKTGGSLLEGILACGRTLGSLGRGQSGGNRTTPLGSARDAVIRDGGAIGLAGRGIRDAADAYRTGDSIGKAVKKGAETVATGARNGEFIPNHMGGGKVVSAVAESVRDSRASGAGAVQTVASAGKAAVHAVPEAAGTAVGTMVPGIGRIREEHADALRERAAGETAAAAAAASSAEEDFGPYTEHYSGTSEGSAPSPAGPASGFSVDYSPDADSFTLSGDAEAAGAYIRGTGSDAMIAGNESAAADIIASGMSPDYSVPSVGAPEDAMNRLGANTVAGSSEALAENLAFRPDYEFGSGNADIGREVVRKLHPELGASMPENVTSYSIPDTFTPEGVHVTGGRAYSYQLGTDSGYKQYDCFSEAAYTAVTASDPASAAQFTAHRLPGGAVEYVRVRESVPATPHRTAAPSSGKGGRKKKKR